jgi:hypothetical protein
LDEPRTRNWLDVETPRLDWQRYAKWDEVLYSLCRPLPAHADRALVYAKVYLIGRSYQTGIERWAKAERQDQKPMDAVAESLLRAAPAVDPAIERLRVLSAQLQDIPNRAALDEICAAHATVLRVLKPVMRKESVQRSFVAKYLHFHAPVVPIYDNLAQNAIRDKRLWEAWSVVPTKRLGRPAAENVDAVYWTYCRRLLDLAEAWRVAGVQVEPTARRLDTYLLWGSWDA